MFRFFDVIYIVGWLELSQIVDPPKNEFEEGAVLPPSSPKTRFKHLLYLLDLCVRSWQRVHN